jgi:hypothetical protein
MRDDLSLIAAEQTIVYEPELRIERLYKFHDGAIVRYEWQASPEGRTAAGMDFNHRFSLVEPPSPNPNDFGRGVIRTIDYPG